MREIPLDVDVTIMRHLHTIAAVIRMQSFKRVLLSASKRYYSPSYRTIGSNSNILTINAISNNYALRPGFLCSEHSPLRNVASVLRSLTHSFLFCRRNAQPKEIRDKKRMEM